MNNNSIKNAFIAIWAFLLAVFITGPLGNLAYEFYKSPPPRFVLFLSDNLAVVGGVIFVIGCLSCLSLWLLIERLRAPSRLLRFSIKKTKGRWEIENSRKDIAKAIKSVRKERQQGGNSRISICLSRMVDRSLLQDPDVSKWLMDQEDFCNKAIDLLLFDEDVRSMILPDYRIDDDIDAIREFIAFYGSSERTAAWDKDAVEEPSLYYLATVIPPGAPEEIRLPHFKISVPTEEFNRYRQQVISRGDGSADFFVAEFSAEYIRRIVLPRSLFIIIACLGRCPNIDQNRIKAARLLRIAEWRVRFG